MQLQSRKIDGRWYADIQDLLLLIEYVKREVSKDHPDRLEVLRIILEDVRKKMQ
jgi:hypothetical protein